VTVAVLPASFDPITSGHVDIIVRAAGLFGTVVVGVNTHPRKNLLFPLEERVAMIRESLDGVAGVEVTAYDGLTVNFARRVGASVLVRGLRAVSDFEAEFQQATLNRKMLPGLEVVCMFASPDFAWVSSSIIKEIAENGGDVTSFVPPPVARRLAERLRQSAPTGR
jgi:pantetheine-phosphate adenylyltransferase